MLSQPFENPRYGTWGYFSCPRVDFTVKLLHDLLFFQKNIPYPPRWLDVGPLNTMGCFMETDLGVHIEYTGETDLDVNILEGEYDIITCLEVLEHLFNPLHLLLELHKVLKPGGLMVLSTPFRELGFSAHHFHEMDKTRLSALIKRAGWVVRRWDCIERVNWKESCKGIRPFLRFLFFKPYVSVLVLGKGEDKLYG